MNLHIGLFSAPKNKKVPKEHVRSGVRLAAESPLAGVSYNLINRTHKGFMS